MNIDRFLKCIYSLYHIHTSFKFQPCIHFYDQRIAINSCFIQNLLHMLIKKSRTDQTWELQGRPYRLSNNQCCGAGAALFEPSGAGAIKFCGGLGSSSGSSSSFYPNCNKFLNEQVKVFAFYWEHLKPHFLGWRWLGAIVQFRGQTYPWYSMASWKQVFGPN